MWFFNANYTLLLLLISIIKHDLRKYIKNKFVTCYENNCKLITWCNNKGKIINLCQLKNMYEKFCLKKNCHYNL